MEETEQAQGKPFIKVEIETPDHIILSIGIPKTIKEEGMLYLQVPINTTL